MEIRQDGETLFIDADLPESVLLCAAVEGAPAMAADAKAMRLQASAPDLLNDPEAFTLAVPFSADAKAGELASVSPNAQVGGLVLSATQSEIVFGDRDGQVRLTRARPLRAAWAIVAYEFGSLSLAIFEGGSLGETVSGESLAIPSTLMGACEVSVAFPSLFWPDENTIAVPADIVAACESAS